MAYIGTPPGVAEELNDPLQRRFRGSARLAEYEITDPKLGEGTFGVVSKAVSKRTGRVVALKKILMHNEKDGFPITALREVKLLKMLSHPNILRLEEMAVERQPGDEKAKTGRKRAILYMVTPYADHDLSGMLHNPNIQFSEAQIKCYMLQLLEGLRYLHGAHILHRDMKAANILITNSGILQIADFGLARHYEGTPPQAGRGNGEAVRDYTSLVVTRWYRPPELLLTLRRYTPAIDMWGVGCVFGEMFELKPILEGKTDVDQCVRIFALVGSPNEQTMPGFSDLPGCEGTTEWDRQKGNIDSRFGSKLGPQGLSLLKQLLCLDWRQRINAVDALQHEYFKTAPLPARPESLPRYQDSHELDSRKRGNQEKERPLPPAPAGGAVGMGPNEWNGEPRNGNHQNGHGAYYDGGRSRGGHSGRDRGPPGGSAAPPRSYDDRRAPPPPSQATGSREPAWKQQDRAPRPAPSSLPPRPADLPPRPDMPPRAAPPPARGSDRAPDQGRNSGGDTYIPAYRADAGYDPRPLPRESYERRNSREVLYREPDAPPLRSYRDLDAAPPPRNAYRDDVQPNGWADSRHSYRERDYPPSRDDRYRTRSRSPAERRERPQERERSYRR